MSRNRPNRPRRRGLALYLTVVGASLLVGIIALSSNEISRARLRSAALARDTEQVRIAAVSAVEIAMRYCNDTPTWRNTLAASPPPPRPFGIGAIQFAVIDDIDGDLKNDDAQPVRLLGSAVFGATKFRVSLLARPMPVSSLTSAVHAGAIVNNIGPDLTATRVVSANDRVINGSGANLNADVESVNPVSNSGTINGTITEGIDPKELPAATVFDHYLANGTQISYGSLPVPATYALIEDVVLSPTQNPFGGGTNTEGIYVIDCQNQEIRVQNARIVGTLVLLNPDPISRIDGSVAWDTAVANYPALMVLGSMQITLLAADLIEQDRNVNFNPAGTPYPYPSGEIDDDFGPGDVGAPYDVYPSKIKGLVFVSNNLETLNAPSFEGLVLVGNTFSPAGTVNVVYQATYVNNPPPGFLSTKIEAIAGSWKQEPGP